jgi:hypothetical protein
MTNTFPPIVEDPDGTVVRQSRFYCTIGGTLDGYLSFDRLKESGHFPSISDTNWRKGSPYLKPQKLPRGIGFLWRYEVITCDRNAFDRYISDLRITTDDLIDLIPDISAWPPFGLVSARAKEVLEDLFPDGSYFYEMTIQTTQGQPIGRPFYHWVPRHRFFFDYRQSKTKLPTHVWPFHWMAAPDPQTAWELTNNASIRDFLDTIPFWGIGMRLFVPAYTNATFAALKAAKLTGLVEDTRAYGAEPNWYESIGHIA